MQGLSLTCQKVNSSQRPGLAPAGTDGAIGRLARRQGSGLLGPSLSPASQQAGGKASCQLGPLVGHTAHAVWIRYKAQLLVQGNHVWLCGRGR